MIPGADTIRCCAAALLVATILVAAGCSRLPSDADARLQHGIDAVEQGDFGEAYWWWRPLADAGMAEAQYHLGWLYANGNGLRVNLPEGIRWWEKAADAGNADAEFAIGLAYLNGDARTLKRDTAMALDWLLRAARHESEDARDILNRLVRTETARTLEQRPDLIAEPWLGTPVRVTGDEAVLREKPGGKAVSGNLSGGTVLRQVDETKGWRRVVRPDQSGFAWLRARDAEPLVPES